MSGSENVFHILQLGRQAGTIDAPGSAVPATVLLPIAEPVGFELDRAAIYPAQDYGRNVRNRRATGYYGVRAAGATVPAEVRAEDFMLFLEMCYKGDVAPAGGIWEYPYETGASTVVPCTFEDGNIDATEAQHRLVSCLINSLQIGFEDLTVPGASPWTLSAEVLAFDREISPLTAGLEPMADVLRTFQGHLTKIYQDDPSVAFASLPELEATLISFSQTAQRNFTRRKYGGDTDIADAYGFSEKSNATYEMKLRISADTKSDFHDVWNTSGSDMGERRLRIQSNLEGGDYLQIDARAGLFAVPYDERDGERVYMVSGEYSDDDDLDANHIIRVKSPVTDLPGS
jgi:hypothetical protein